MDDKMQSLRDNDTFTLNTLPDSKKAVEGDGCMELRTILLDLTNDM